MTTQPSEMDVLKAQVKTLKRIVYGFGCLFVAGIALAATSMQGVPDVIKAKKFEVVNDEGRIMAGLGAFAEGGYLAIGNKDGKQVAALMTTLFGGKLNIDNKDGKLTASLFATPKGGVLKINNKDEKKVAGLAAESDGGILAIYDNKKNITFEVLPEASGGVRVGETAAAGPILRPLSEQQLETMSTSELQQVLRAVMNERRSARNDPELSNRLRDEQNLIFKYLQEHKGFE